MECLISVIIPVYNRKELIRATIQSVQEQTYNNIEIIVVDDNSSDGTEQIVQEMMETDKRIKYFRNSENLGGGASRNVGIENASGSIVAFLDSDDIWRKERLQEQVLAFNDEEIVAAFCNYDMIQYETGKIVGTNNKASRKRKEKIYEGNYLGTTSCLMARRNIMLSIGMFDVRLKSCQDWDVYIRLIQSGSINYSSKILLTQFFHNKRLSGNKENVIQGLSLLIDKMPEYCKYVNFSKYKTDCILSNLFYRLGTYFCDFGDTKGARRCLITSMKKNILNIKGLKLILRIIKITK